MTTAIVQAHPVPDSLNAELLRRVEAGCDAAGIEALTYRLPQGGRPSVEQMREHRELVLVYPTWWGGQPAQLLDWLQEMLAADALGSVRRLTAVTTLGSSRLVNLVQGEWGRVLLAGQVLDACRGSAEFAWLPLYKIDRRSQEEIDEHLASVQAHFADLRPVR
ncbi:MAG: NAD(P)H-dependent oxidoreductase [Actinomycetota bacterium]